MGEVLEPLAGFLALGDVTEHADDDPVVTEALHVAVRFDGQG